MTENRVATDPTGASTPPTETPRGDPPDDDDVIDCAVIDQLASITNSEGMSVLSELLHAFLGAVPARLDAIEKAVADCDLAGVAHQAHALTGSSASFGARGMANTCRRLRAAAEDDDVEESRMLGGDLHAEYVLVRASLVSLIGTRA